MGSTDSLVTLARPLLAAAGLDLWDVETGPRLVRILVDRPGGVDLDAVATANAAIAPLLDEHDELLPAGPYDLEVSSPGIERNLRTPEHFGRSLGQVVAVRTRRPLDGSRRFQGRLAAAADDTVDVDVEGSGVRRIPLADIDRAHIVFEWGAAAKPARPAKGPRPGAARRPPSDNDTGAAHGAADTGDRA